MDSTTTAPIEAAPGSAPTGAKDKSTKRQIRGSSLLLVGRVLTNAVNFGVQILMVRYLSKTDYGAFAYALSIVALGETIATIGLDRAITRFVPIYHEQRDYNKLFGTILLVVSTISVLGFAMILLIFGFQGLLTRSFVNDPQAVTLLVIMIALSPLQALNGLLMSLLAIFGKPRAIFFRKYMLGPALKLAVVLLLVWWHGDVFFLASGQVVAGIMGTVVYIAILWRVMRDERLFEHFNFQSLIMPAREIFAFTIPLLTSDLVYTLMNSSDAVLLEHFRGTADVAAFRVVQPTAGLNQLVIGSFTLLFTPLAARLFARNDREGLNNLYWQTAIWMAVLSFPIFAVTFSLAKPITVLLYEKRYADSAVILALLSFGYYFNTALGFNGLTLKVFGKLRYIVVINLLAAAINVGINLLLIPRYGALGAAIGTCGTLVAYNIFKQAGLQLGTGISLFERRHLKVYGVITLGVVLLLVVQITLSPPIIASLALSALVSLVVVGLTRKSLHVGQTFPELRRLPIVGRLLGD